MNERLIVVGQNSNGIGYFAHWANDAVIFSGNTPEEATQELFMERYFHIWHLNDMDKVLPQSKQEIQTTIGPIGVCTHYFNRRTCQPVGPPFKLEG